MNSSQQLSFSFSDSLAESFVLPSRELSIAAFFQLPLDTRVLYLNRHFPTMSAAVRSSLLR